jgi:lipopolysaccharide export system permease protein
MKKEIYKILTKDIASFFLLTTLSLGVIIWVIQAVNLLDIVSEDGHSFRVYFFYTLLSLPKVFSKILPFIFFVSIFYILIKFENNNELIIYWSIGISKLKMINLLISISFFYMLLQLILTSYVVPNSSDKARSYFRSSNIDLFSSLIKERRFIDTVANLTIFVEEKNGNDLKKIYFKDNIGVNQSQIIFAKTGKIVNENNKNTLLLYDGKFINTINQKQSIFKFSETEIDLSKYTTKTTTHPKIQETMTLELYNCITSIINFKKTFTTHDVQFKKKNCSLESFNNVKEELFKRIFLPIYFPVLALLASLLVLQSKNYAKFFHFKLFVFFTGVLTLIISEISVKYFSLNNFNAIIFSILPIFIFLSIYLFLLLKNKLKTI